jgi:hypothetical protein
MKLQDHLLRIVSALILGYMFKQYAAPYMVSSEKILVNKFLYNESYSDMKENMWIYVALDVNSIKWETFNERKSLNLNKPYVEYCLKNTIKENKNDFNILIVTDNDIQDLIPNWNLRLEELSGVSKTRARRLAKMNLLYYYGGILVPASMLCISSLKPYKTKLETGFFVECDTDEIILGVKKQNPKLKTHLYEIQGCIQDLSKEVEFKDLLNTSLNMCGLEKVDKRKFGLAEENGTDITLDKLLGYSEINYVEDLCGIYIPYNLTSTKYGWFNNESVEQIGNSTMFISKYFKCGRFNDI